MAKNEFHYTCIGKTLTKPRKKIKGITIRTTNLKVYGQKQVLIKSDISNQFIQTSIDNAKIILKDFKCKIDR